MDLLDGDEVSPLRCVDRTCSPLRDLRALHATAEVLATGSGQEEMLLKILQTLETEVGMTRGTVMLVSPDGSELQLAAATGVAHGERGKLRYRAGEGITGEVLRTGKSIIVPRISAEPRFQEPDSFAGSKREDSTELHLRARGRGQPGRRLAGRGPRLP